MRRRRPTAADDHRARRPPAAPALLLLPFLWLSFGSHGPEDLPRVEAEVRERFPEVRQLGAAELERMLAAPEPHAVPLLLDVREPREYAVSHLPGAMRAATVEEALAVLEEADPRRPVVVYCSVGYRSSRLARALAEAGRPGAANLEGSIFAWANSGRPVVRGGREVREVHPYDRKWGQLLRRELHATGSRVTEPR